MSSNRLIGRRMTHPYIINISYSIEPHRLQGDYPLSFLLNKNTKETSYNRDDIPYKDWGKHIEINISNLPEELEDSVKADYLTKDFINCLLKEINKREKEGKWGRQDFRLAINYTIIWTDDLNTTGHEIDYIGTMDECIIIKKSDI